MRKVIKKEHVRVDDAMPALPAGQDAVHQGGHHGVQHDGQHDAPAVRVIRTEGRITAIECTCHCGERTALEFEYGALEAIAPTSDTQSASGPPADAQMQTEVE